MTRMIVFGNAKGGTGKSTLAMHLTVALLNHGLKVATLDLDARQGTLSRYVANRRRYADRTRTELSHPEHAAILSSGVPGADEAELTKALDRAAGCDVIVVDTPGADTE